MKCEPRALIRFSHITVSNKWVSRGWEVMKRQVEDREMSIAMRDESVRGSDKREGRERERWGERERERE